jgi:hypothetical protein
MHAEELLLELGLLFLPGSYSFKGRGVATGSLSCQLDFQQNNPIFPGRTCPPPTVELIRKGSPEQRREGKLRD